MADNQQPLVNMTFIRSCDMDAKVVKKWDANNIMILTSFLFPITKLNFRSFLSRNLTV